MVSPRGTPRSKAYYSRYNAVARPTCSPRSWASYPVHSANHIYDMEEDMRLSLIQKLPIFLAVVHYKYEESSWYTARADCVDCLSILLTVNEGISLTSLILKKLNAPSLSSLSPSAITAYMVQQVEHIQDQKMFENSMNPFHYRLSSPNAIVLQGYRRETVFLLESGPIKELRSNPPRTSSFQPSKALRLTSRLERNSKDDPKKKSAAASQEASVIIMEDLVECNIYTLRKVTYVQIQSCKNCRVVIPTAAACVTVNACTNLELFCVCRNLKVENSYDAKLHVYVTTPIILIGDTRGTEIGPYSAIFSKQKEFMVHAGIKCTDTLIACWVRPIVLGLRRAQPKDFSLAPSNEQLLSRRGSLQRSLMMKKSPNNRDLDKLYPEDTWPSSVYILVSPANFKVFVVPECYEAEELDPKKNKLQSYCLFLPEIYAEQFKKMQNTVKEKQRLLAEIQSSLKDRGDQKIISQLCYNHFVKWLSQAGYGRELIELARIDLLMLEWRSESENTCSSA